MLFDLIYFVMFSGFYDYFFLIGALRTALFQEKKEIVAKNT